MKKPELPSRDNYPEAAIKAYESLKSNIESDIMQEQLALLINATYATGYQDGIKDMLYLDEMCQLP